MATSTVDPTSNSTRLLRASSLPIIDLRFLSQPELLSLSSSPSSSYNPQNDAVLSPNPKIDKSVFNESAGSRKQTFSRLRLAPPRNLQNLNPSPNRNRNLNWNFTPSHLPQLPQPQDEEDPQVVSLLNSLFGSSDPGNLVDEEYEDEKEGGEEEEAGILENLVSIPVQCEEYPVLRPSSDEELRNVAIEMAGAAVGNKRKRGRPRKGAEEVEEEEEGVCVDGEGVVLGLAAKMEDPYGEELARRTEGMVTGAELLGFLEGFEGEWLSKKRKRRIMEARVLGELLPVGWKLVVCVMKRAGIFWLSCRRYISPDGQQFASYAEASSYSVSVSGLHETSNLNFDPISGSGESTNKLTSQNIGHDIIREDHDWSTLSHVGPKTTENKEQPISLIVTIPENVQTEKKYGCHKCSEGYDEPDDLLEHLLSHQKTPKRLRLEPSVTEKVIIKNGKYECQFCLKSFEERRRFNGHLGNHIKDYVKRLSASVGVATRCMIAPASVGIPHEVLEIPEIKRTDHSVALTSGMISGHDYQSNLDIPDGQLKAADAYNGTYCGNQARSCDFNDHKDGTMNEDTDVASYVINSCSGLVSDLMSNKCDGRTSQKGSFSCVDNGINKVVQEERVDIISLESCKWYQERVVHIDNKVNQMTTSLMVGLGQNTSIVPAQKSVELSGKEDKEIFDRIKEDRDSEGGDMFRRGGAVSRPGNCGIEVDVMRNIKQKLGSEGCSVDSCGNVERFGSIDDEMGHRNNFSKNFSPSRFNSVNSELTIGFVDINAQPIDDIMTFDTLEHSQGNCSVIPSGNEQLFPFDSINGPTKCTIRKPYQENRVNNSPLNVPCNEPSFVFGYNMVEASNHMTEVPKQVEVSWSDKCEFGSDIPLGEGTLRNLEQQRSFISPFLAPSTGEQASSLNEYHLHDSRMEKLRDLNNLSSSWTGILQEEPQSHDIKEPLQNELMISLNSRNQFKFADSKYMWNTKEENEMIKGVSDMPSRLVQSSACFPSSGVHLDKGESEISGEKFDSASCFEDLRLGSMGNIYCDLSSFSNESNLFPDETEMTQGFDSSAWLEKEALPLLPKVATRHLLSNVCVWCKNEFPYEALESGVQTGSMAFTCAVCKAKFSGGFSFF